MVKTEETLTEDTLTFAVMLTAKQLRKISALLMYAHPPLPTVEQVLGRADAYSDARVMASRGRVDRSEVGEAPRPSSRRI